MPPGRIGPRTPREPWHSESQEEYDSDWDSQDWTPTSDDTSNIENESTVEGVKEVPEPVVEVPTPILVEELTEAEIENSAPDLAGEVLALASDEPAPVVAEEMPAVNDEPCPIVNEDEPAPAPTDEDPAEVIEIPIPSLPEEVPDHTFIWLANDEASSPKEKDKFDNDDEPAQTTQQTENVGHQSNLKTEAQPVDEQAPQEVQPKLMPEEKRVKEEEVDEKMAALEESNEGDSEAVIQKSIERDEEAVSQRSDENNEEPENDLEEWDHHVKDHQIEKRENVGTESLKGRPSAIPTPTIPLDKAATATTSNVTPSISLTAKERKKATKAYRSKKKEKPKISKEAAKWDKQQRKKAERIKKEADRRAKALRLIKQERKKQKEREREAADRKAFLEKVEYQHPRVAQHVRRAALPLDVPHPAARVTSQGIKDEEQRWKMDQGGTSDADRAAAAAEIAKAAKDTELERLQGAERAEAAAARLVASSSMAPPNAYFDHDSYDPAMAHVAEEAAGAVRPTVGSAQPELGLWVCIVFVLCAAAILFMVVRRHRRRADRSPPRWNAENGQRGLWEPGRKKRQSEEQKREKFDV